MVAPPSTPPHPIMFLLFLENHVVHVGVCVFFFLSCMVLMISLPLCLCGTSVFLNVMAYKFIPFVANDKLFPFVAVYA